VTQTPDDDLAAAREALRADDERMTELLADVDDEPERLAALVAAAEAADAAADAAVLPEGVRRYVEVTAARPEDGESGPVVCAVTWLSGLWAYCPRCEVVMGCEGPSDRHRWCPDCGGVYVLDAAEVAAEHDRGER
jgi:hypothetical protein